MRARLKSFRGCQFSSRITILAILLSAFLVAQPVIIRGDDQIRSKQVSLKKLLKRARKQMRKGLFSQSAETINKVLSRDPGNKEARLDLAYVYLKQRKVFDAHDIAFEVAREDPRDSYAFAILGAAYLGGGSFHEARVLLNNSLTLNRREALAWASLGMLNYYENKIETSIRNLKEAVYHDRGEPDFALALAQVSARGERYRDSAKAYEKFLRIAPKADKERRDRIKGLIKFLTFLGKRVEIYSTGGDKKTTVNTIIVNNRPIIPVRLKKNGKVLNFVLDTGSGITVISEETAKEFKIRPVARGGVARAIGGNGKFAIVYGFLNAMRIGDVKVSNVPVYIRKFQRNTVRIDGYIGISLISRYITTLDYENKTLSLVKKDEDSNEQYDMEGALTIPLRMTSSGFLSGNVKLGGVADNLNFILDTGASVSVVSEDLAEETRVKENLLEQRMRVIGAAGVTDNVPMYLLQDVDFGGASTPNLRAVALDLDLINESSGFTQAGILGGNFLKDYKLTFDFKASRVILVPN
ncbi:MAG: hypothetical protein HKN33_09975 [Pyrinomonadaceae bacterium]|nr:hypothetical protein [Pyrinomonadaceae bacterium]